MSGPASAEPDGYASAIRELLAHHFGSRPARLRHNWFGHASVVYTAWIGDQTVVVRANPSAALFASTLRNIEILRGLGIPAPEVLFADLSMTTIPFAYMVAREIPGHDLRFELPTMSQEQQAIVAGQVMEYQRRVGTLPRGGGYGFVGIGETGPHQSWRAVVESEALQAGPTVLLHDRLLEALESIAPHLNAVPPICFLDDLTTKNVILKDGILQGVVDFDCVCYGDPLFHVGLTQTAVAFDLPDPCLTYVEHLCDAGAISAEGRRVVDIYSAHHGLDFLARITDPAEYAQGVVRVSDWLVRAGV